MKINRFPKMAALQKERALKLGFREDISKAIGIAEATKYAIFKNLPKKSKKKTPSSGKSIELNNELYSIFKLQALDGLPYVGGKVYSPQDYDRAFIKFGEKAKKIEEWAKGVIQNCDEKLLKSENKFFNECWKKHRDENIE